MRRLLNVKVIKTRGLENMLIIVFILLSRPGGLTSHICWSRTRIEWVDWGWAQLRGGCGGWGGLLLTQPWCSGRDFASLPSEPHVWSSAGVSDRSQKPQQHRSEVHWLRGFYAVIVELISCVRDKVVELGCPHLCEHSLSLLTTEKRWTACVSEPLEVYRGNWPNIKPTQTRY